MGTFSIFCSEGRARDIKNELTAEGFYVEAKIDAGGYHFTVDGSPNDDEADELVEIRVLRAIVSVLSTYAADKHEGIT